MPLWSGLSQGWLALALGILESGMHNIQTFQKLFCTFLITLNKHLKPTKNSSLLSAFTMNFYSTILHWVFEIVLNWGTKSARRLSICNFCLWASKTVNTGLLRLAPPGSFISLSHPVDFQTDAFGCSHSSKIFSINGKWSLCWQKRDKPGDLSNRNRGLLSSPPLLLPQKQLFTCWGSSHNCLLSPPKCRSTSPTLIPRGGSMEHQMPHSSHSYPGYLCDRVLSSSNRVSKIIEYCFFLNQQSHQRVWAFLGRALLRI